jgi:hypothetical protein
MNYFATLIAVADDGPVASSVVPAERGGKKTVAVLQYEMIKEHACLRSSPLAKKYGFGLLFDREGRVALCPMESTEYKHLVNARGDDVKIVKALRSQRG